MFLKFLNLGRKPEDDQPARRRTDRTSPDSTQCPTPLTGDATKADGDASSFVAPKSPTGRDSLSKLKSVALGQRIRHSGQEHWFAKPDDGSSAVAYQVARQTDAQADCPAVPEAERLKAIDELLKMGINHFTVRDEQP